MKIVTQLSSRRNEETGQETLVTKILESDRRIRYCAIIDEKGREILGGMRPGVKSLESESGSNKLRMQHVIHLAMRRNWNKFHGRMNFVIVHRSKVTLFIFPFSGTKSLLISAEPDYSLKGFEKLAEIVNAASEKMGDVQRKRK